MTARDRSLNPEAADALFCRPLDQFDCDLVFGSQIGNANARIRTADFVHVRRGDRLSPVPLKPPDRSIDIVHVKRDMRKAYVARPRGDHNPLGRRKILDQFYRVIGSPQIGDLYSGALNPRNGLNRGWVATSA